MTGQTRAIPAQFLPSPGRIAVRWTEALAVIAGLAAPWRDLLARLFLAQGFLIAEAAQLMQPTGRPFAEASASLLAAVASSDLGRVMQALAPLLLLAGLFSRLAAVLLLVQLALLPALSTGLAVFWTPLLLWVVVAGPGRLSIDTVLRPAMHASALAGIAAIGRGFRAATRYGAPWLLALIRLWTAALLAASALPQGNAMKQMAASLTHAGWLPPALLHAPDPLLAALAACLVAGVAVRPIALGLIVALPMGTAMALDERLYWGLLLGLPLLQGGGAGSVDRLIAARFARAFPRVRDLPAAALERLPRVVIVGGGFGGVAAAQALRNRPCQITLLDRRNFTLFQPLLYQVATAGLSPADIATPIRTMFRQCPNVRVLLGEVTGIDTGVQEVLLGRRRLAYDYLVLATGARHAYFGRDDWASSAPGLKQIEDATDIRRRLLSAFEAAESAATAEERRAWLTFLVVGGGPTGVEMAGAIAELARESLEDEFRAADPTSARIVLVQSDRRVLPTFPENLSEHAATSLRRLGVELLLGRRVTAVDGEGVGVDDERIPAKTVIWAAGVMASPAGKWVTAETDRAGRTKVGPDLSIPGLPNVFAIGDTAASDGWAGKPVPGVAPAAKQGGAYVARVIRARILGRAAPGPFRYQHLGSLATIGRQAAVADFGRLRLHGAPAWWLWGSVHLAFLIGGRNRLTVLVQWLWAYLTYQRGTRLITGSGPDAAP